MNTNNLNLHYYENTQKVVDLSDGNVTEICSFKDCGITPSKAVVLNGSVEMDRRDDLVHDYLLDADLSTIFGPTVTSCNSDVTPY